jgi:hypothetical protein
MRRLGPLTSSAIMSASGTAALAPRPEIRATALEVGEASSRKQLAFLDVPEPEHPTEV